MDNAARFSTYHSLGWCPMPLKARDKIPMGSWKAYQRKRPALEQCLVWNGGDSNVGIVTGDISGIFVLDIDGRQGAETLGKLEAEHGALPQTVTACTGNGWHWYFRLPEGYEIRNLSGQSAEGAELPGVDVRGNGGYVVAPPSIHPNGRSYYWMQSPMEMAIAEAPAWLLKLVAQPTATPVLDFNDAADNPNHAYLDAALRGELAALAQASNGTRNAQLNKAAFALGQLISQGISEQDVRGKLEAVALAIGLDRGEITRTINSGIAAGTATPRTDKTDTTPVSSVLSVDNQPVSAGEWPEPKPVVEEWLPVAALDPAIIPEPLRAWVVDISDRMQCPIDYVAASSIVALGSLIGARCSIHPKRQDGNWFIVPNLWGAIIGKPSTLKSPALAEVLRPIRRLEMDSRDEHSKAMQDHKMKAHMAKAQEEKIMRDLADIAQGKYKGTKSAEELQAQCNAIEFPKEPQWKRYHTNDATVEKLSELLSANPQGMLVFRDELIGLLKSWEKEGHAGDRAFFLEAWNGFGSHITDRIGRGTIYTENVCLSLLGSTQPSRLAQYLRQGLRDIGNDGLIQRFQLMVMPDDVKEWQLVDRTGNMFAKERADLIFATLSVMDYVQHGARTSDDKKPPYFRFDDAAQELFYEWLIRLETVKLRGNEEGLLLEHLTKYRKLMPALALIFHLVSVADGTASGAVSAEATRLAIAWCDYLETHARRIYHMATDVTQQAAKALSRRIRKKEIEDSFTIRSLYRKGWQGLDDQELAEAACDELVRLGWLKEMHQPASPAGGRSKTSYRINPKLRGGDAG
ncbi:MAG: DUF3987 domain-containing protein [Alphaproteobacteria bacterium]